MRPIIRVMLASLLCVLGTRAAQADLLCQVTFVCYYESPGFHFKVVDKETGQPLADVHALAEWVMYGRHGRNGPLMVQDAVSGGPDGMLVFPAWGPERGPRSGLVLNNDPVITLFKPGYKTLLFTNAYPEGTEETTRVRRFGQDGQTVRLEPFRGSSDQWIEQLRLVAWGAPSSRSDELMLRFRTPYLNRLSRVWAESPVLPPKYLTPGQFLWHVEREIRFLKDGTR